MARPESLRVHCQRMNFATALRLLAKFAACPWPRFFDPVGGLRDAEGRQEWQARRETRCFHDDETGGGRGAMAVGAQNGSDARSRPVKELVCKEVRNLEGFAFVLPSR